MQVYTERAARGTDHGFKQVGHQIPVQHQKKPGLQEELEYPKPVSTHIPTEEGDYTSAIITGGDSGIGRAIAILFAMEGASSLIVYLPEEEKDAQETKRRVRGTGHDCHCLTVDVRKKESCREVVDTAMQCMGGIDILVNNAGFQNMIGDISGLEVDQWERTFDTNIHPFFYLSKYALLHMRSGSTIINSTKGAIVAFTRALSNQQVGRGIRVNCVCPGPIWTLLIPSTMNSAAMDEFSSVPIGRPGQLSEVATCFVFLASQDSSYISGQSLHPNGGVVVNG
ncbi:hypothetical protein BDV38DRAFT_275211 [Aspergillus pseudotamarii]|uniref:Oxidoreductase n=1 Tax=Aspergillus pseudotamarii TaxID=132259 RepID=A0A5N6SCG1_ASPPS|nr:uncharacterized protein BDV38DRAFT_275211 [Aspergillus pseudotamarii]KAE8132275.1 hypothetical protein BDV38DRAFT_275211 [Aspergillus pseudotamarii]